MLSLQPITYAESLQLWKTQRFETNLENYYHLFQNNPALEIILNAGPSLTMIMDMRTSAYVYVSKNCEQVIGYTSEQLMKGGPHLGVSLIHPEDVKGYLDITKVVWEFLLSLPPAKRKFYKTSCDFRIITKTGTTKRLIQQNTALQTDKLGNIVLLLMVITDISHLKKDNTITGAILSVENEGCLIWDANDTQLKSQIALSKREREIIRLLAEGFITKQIAQRLNVSEHTVNTHRRNMMEKTKSHNARALIRFAISHGVI